MSLHVIFLLVACVCSAQSWDMGGSLRFPSIQQQQQQPIPKRPQCLGLARRTRQMRINVPVIYNSRTGQTSPVPQFLYAADETVIARIENEGWEIRRNSVYIPQLVYERVPVCCPWDQNCFQGRPAVPAQTSDTSGPCANGGQLIYRDGQQRCECPPGFFGSWCQMYDRTGESQSRISFPSGPLVRVFSTPSPIMKPMTGAELRRAQIMQSPVQPVMPGRDQVVSTAAKPWAYRAAMLKQQIIRAKVAQMEEMYRQSQGNAYNHMQQPGNAYNHMQQPGNAYNHMQQPGNAYNHMQQPGSAYNHMQQPGLSPYDARQGKKIWGHNPYNSIDARGGNNFPPRQNTDYNPYNALSYQGQLPPHMMRAFSAVQDELRQKQANPYNPYGRLPQEIPRPPPLVLPQRMNGNPNPYNRLPQGMDVPQARTPWDLDPFGQQQNPSYMNYPGMPVVPYRNKQAMAMALYQQMMNQHRARLSQGNNSVNRRPVNPVPTPGTMSPVSSDSQPRPLTAVPTQEENNQSAQELGSNTTAQIVEQQQTSGLGPNTGAQIEQQRPLELNPNTGAQIEQQRPLELGPNTGAQIVEQQQSSGLGPNTAAQNEQQRSLELDRNTGAHIVEQQQNSGLGPNTGAQIEQQRPSELGPNTGAQIVDQQPSTDGPLEEAPLDGPTGQQVEPNSREVKQIEQCQAVLTPKLNTCLQDYDLVMEQFMNPEFMEKARAVCESSESVGQCIMQHDKACGGDGDAILTTRKMINSALQMMGMICQQISARGDLPNNPMQGPLGSPLRGVPTPASNDPPQSVNEVQEPPMNKEEAPKRAEVRPHVHSHKPSAAKSAQDVGDEPMSAVSQEYMERDSAFPSRMGHDSAHPVSMELKLFGYPLWLVVSLGLALFVALILFVLVLCLCCRRRCRGKSVKITKEIEKIPVPLDRKLCTIDIPPPSYNTTVISQNEDAFVLPPLSLEDDDSINEKFPAKGKSETESDDKERKKDSEK